MFAESIHPTIRTSPAGNFNHARSLGTKSPTDDNTLKFLQCTENPVKEKINLLFIFTLH